MVKTSMTAKLEMSSMLTGFDEDKKKKGMSKCQIAAVLSTMCNHKQSDMETFLDTLAKLAIQELRDKQKFEIPGIVLIKNNYKPERKGGRIKFLGQKFNVKAKAAHYVVKAYPIFPLKRDVEKWQEEVLRYAWTTNVEKMSS